MIIDADIEGAGARLSHLIAAAELGDTVFITRGGVRVVRFEPIPHKTPLPRDEMAAKLRRARGMLKGRIDSTIDWEVPSMSEADVARWGLTAPWTDAD